jgi:hypothetical protein
MKPRNVIVIITACIVVTALGLIGFVVSAGGTSATHDSAFMARCLGLTPGARGEKLALRERECQKREAASSGLSVTQDLEQKAALRAAPRSAEGPPPKRLTGLFIERQGPAGTNQTFHATSNWAGHVDGQWYLVYAGARANPQTNQDIQSEVRVYREPAELNSNESNIFVGSYVPPGGGSGPLTIASATGSMLAIRTSTGATLSFDVGQRAISTE